MRKDEIASEITKKIGVTPVVFSRGSTEPKELLIQIALALGIQHHRSLSKPQLAKLIVEHSGLPWLDNYESNGSTITKRGMLALKEAVDFFFKT
jgi:hypothetical protein